MIKHGTDNEVWVELPADTLDLLGELVEITACYLHEHASEKFQESLSLSVLNYFERVRTVVMTKSDSLDIANQLRRELKLDGNFERISPTKGFVRMTKEGNLPLMLDLIGYAIKTITENK